MKVPAPFGYTSDKAVSWNYTSQAVIQEPQAAAEQKPDKSINDIAKMEGMTRNGRCYAPIISGARERESSTENRGIKIAASREKTKK